MPHMRTRRPSIITAATAFRTIAPAAPRPEAPPEGDAPAALSRFWEGPVTLEGVMTGDGRLIEVDALTWDADLAASPLPLRLVTEDVGAHDGAVTVGRIQSLQRLTIEQANARLTALDRPTLAYGGEARVIWGAGDFDFDGELGEEAARQVREDLTDGVSIDPDDVAFEVRVRADLVEESDEMLEAMLNDDDTDYQAPERRQVGDHVVVMEAKPDDEIMVIMSGRIRAATLVATPAFADARISLTDAAPTPIEDAPVEDEADGDGLTAAAAPVDPPRSWFADPKLSAATPVTITDEGRIFGHLATWDVCHIASPAGEGVCVTAPHSSMGYARFHTGTLRTDDGDVIDVGRITMGTGHAGPRANGAAAAAHYDHTGLAVADVRAGEDVHGIWVAGALRPDVTPEQIRTLRASPLSGDWRFDNDARGLELRAALAVNVPGFPIPRPAGLVASGELTTLVASGVLVAEETIDVATAPGTTLSASDQSYLQRIIDRERNADRTALATRVNAARAALARRKVAAFVAARR